MRASLTSYSDPTLRAAFWRGWWACAPFVVAAVPFGVLFGVVARDAGLDLIETMAMSVLVIAGASQFTALSLLQENASAFLALFAALAVNLRMAMYSAALVPHLGHAPIWQRALMAYLMVDQAYAVAGREFEDNPAMSKGEKVAFYFGAMLLICPLWYGATLTGALVGESIPATWSLDFAAPVCFIALIAPMLRSLPHILAAFTSVVFAMLFAPLPTGVGLLLAAFVAMLVGAETERRIARRRTPA